MAGSSREWAEENDTDGDQGRGCREKLDGVTSRREETNYECEKGEEAARSAAWG